MMKCFLGVMITVSGVLRYTYLYAPKVIIALVFNKH